MAKDLISSAPLLAARTAKLRRCESALELIRAARDHCAEHGVYPPHPAGPAADQGFDDWAADLAETALNKEA